MIFNIFNVVMYELYLQMREIDWVCKVEGFVSFGRQ